MSWRLSIGIFLIDPGWDWISFIMHFNKTGCHNIACKSWPHSYLYGAINWLIQDMDVSLSVAVIGQQRLWFISYCHGYMIYIPCLASSKIWIYRSWQYSFCDCMFLSWGGVWTLTVFITQGSTCYAIKFCPQKNRTHNSKKEMACTWTIAVWITKLLRLLQAVALALYMS